MVDRQSTEAIEASVRKILRIKAWDMVRRRSRIGLRDAVMLTGPASGRVVRSVVALYAHCPLYRLTHRGEWSVKVM